MKSSVGGVWLYERRIESWWVLIIWMMKELRFFQHNANDVSI